MTTVLVTGGGGFLGRAIVERCLARGWRVRSLSRGEYPELAALGVEQRPADLCDRDRAAEACRGCEIVFHVAAKAGIWGPRREYVLANTLGTANVVRGCLMHGVPRLVHTSSPSVVFAGGHQRGIDESTPYPTHYVSHYAASKAAAERIALSANNCRGVRSLALRPHLIWGPRDNHIVPRLLARARAGQLRRVGDGTNRVDTTYIDNAADAHLSAAEALQSNPAAAGRAYFIANGEPQLLWELIDRILAADGAPPVRRRISHRAAYAAGAVLELVHGVLRLRSEPRMTRFVADELATEHWFDLSAARRELGYAPRVSVAEGLERLGEWLRAVRTSPDREPAGYRA
jgi:nucleoside-diphosphate-sugar epimerase